MTEPILIICVFYAGYALGAWINRKPPIINYEIKVDEKFLFDLDNELLHSWGEQRGLVWMPKGVADIVKESKHD